MDTTYYVLLSLCFTSFLKQSIGIIGGDEVEPHTIPYQAFLSITGNDGSTWRCGGSLITTNYVLTAGRCCSGASSIEIILGAHDVSTKETNQVRLESKNFTIHPQFTTNVPNFVYIKDIAIVALPEPVELNKYIQTVRLPPQEYTFKYINRIGRISGWGFTDGFNDSSYSSVLQAQEQKIISNKECTYVYFDLASYDICMETNETVSPCVGDYGSPLTITDDTDIQIGIASQHIAYCVPGYPFLYTRVSDFLDWIEEVTDYKEGNYVTTSSEPTTTSVGVDTTSSTTSEVTGSDGTTEWISTTTSRGSCVFFSSEYFLVGLVLILGNNLFKY